MVNHNYAYVDTVVCVCVCVCVTMVVDLPVVLCVMLPLAWSLVVVLFSLPKVALDVATL